VQRQFLTLPMIDRISKNEMPFCFNTQRETLVAMAILLMTALRQNEELATALQMQGSQTQHSSALPATAKSAISMRAHADRRIKRRAWKCGRCGRVSVNLDATTEAADAG
jgi:hypothetical protein